MERKLAETVIMNLPAWKADVTYVTAMHTVLFVQLNFSKFSTQEEFFSLIFEDLQV